MHCLYLTHSLRNAVQLQSTLRNESIRIHRTVLSELDVVLRLTGARVIIVDIAFAGDQLLPLLAELSSLAPHCSLVIAAPALYADLWDLVMSAGAFDLILTPFHRQEAASVLRGANGFARKYLSAEACTRRVRNVLALTTGQPKARGGLLPN